MATPINIASSNQLPVLVSDSSAAAAAPIEESAPAERTRQTSAATGSRAPLAASPAEDARQSAEELARATRDISEYMQTVSRSLQISVDKDLGSTVIRVMDTDTEELIRQIPAEEALEIARFIAEQRSDLDNVDPMKGLLMDSEG